MTSYTYRAIDGNGKLQHGEVEADDEADALERVFRQGLTPTALTQGRESLRWWAKEIRFSSRPTPFTPAELEQFFSTFASVLSAQMPVTRALKTCIALNAQGSLKRHLERALIALEDGSQLWIAIGDPDGRFPDRLVKILRMGEASNSLAKVVAGIASALRSEADVRNQLRKELVYPIILLFMSFLVLSVLIFYLAPSLSPIFEATGAPLPLVITLMLGIRSSFVEYWAFLLVFFICFSLFATGIAKRLHRTLQPIFLRLPVTGRYLRERETLRFCQSLDLMLSSGARLVLAIEAAADAVTLKQWSVGLKIAANEIKSGSRLSDGLIGSGLLDAKTAAVLSAAEESDTLVEALPKIVVELHARTTRTLGQAVQLLTPLMTMLIGILIGFIILSTVSAIMDLNDAVL
jgi:type II secretory pathway component PulF